MVYECVYHVAKKSIRSWEVLAGNADVVDMSFGTTRHLCHYKDGGFVVEQKYNMKTGKESYKPGKPKACGFITVKDQRGHRGVAPGSLVEAVTYDRDHCEQGKSLWKVIHSEPRRKDGVWTEALLGAMSDAHLQWWVTKGPGSTENRRFRLHFCSVEEGACTQVKRNKPKEFHTDYFRSLDLDDLTSGSVTWLKSAHARTEALGVMAVVSGGAPRGRPSADETQRSKDGVRAGSAKLGQLGRERPRRRGRSGSEPQRGRSHTSQGEPARSERSRSRPGQMEARRQSRPDRGRPSQTALGSGAASSIRGDLALSAATVSQDPNLKGKLPDCRLLRADTGKEKSRAKERPRSSSTSSSSDDMSVSTTKHSPSGIQLRAEEDPGQQNSGSAIRGKKLGQPEKVEPHEGVIPRTSHPAQQRISGLRPGSQSDTSLTQAVSSSLLRQTTPKEGQVLAAAKKTSPVLLRRDVSPKEGRTRAVAQAKSERLLRQVNSPGEFLAAEPSLAAAKGTPRSLLRLGESQKMVGEVSSEKASGRSSTDPVGAESPPKKKKLRRPQSPVQGKDEPAVPPAGESEITPPILPDLPPDLSECLDGCPVNLTGLNMRLSENLQDWSGFVREIFKVKGTFSELGRQLLGALSTMPTPLGNFVRSFCLAAQPPSFKGVGVGSQQGELLPIAVWKISSSIDGVTDDNVDWLKAVISVINFQYCVGWSRPCCVPIADALSSTQAHAISRMAGVLDVSIPLDRQLMSWEDCHSKLSGRVEGFDNRPVGQLVDLQCAKIIPAWPSQGETCLLPLEALLSVDTRRALEDPFKMLLPREKMPGNAPRSVVMATEDEWLCVVQAAWQRGLMKPVEDTAVPRDRSGHLITIGAGAIDRVKVVNGQTINYQSFVPVMTAINSVMVALPRRNDLESFLGVQSPITVPGDKLFYWDSMDLMVSFSTVAIPATMLGFFSFARKVNGSAMGMSPNTTVRPALCVLPMGWLSSKTLVLEVMCELLFNKAGIPRSLGTEKHRALPAGRNAMATDTTCFDILEVFKAVDMDLLEKNTAASVYTQRLIAMSEAIGLPYGLLKQMIHSMVDGMQCAAYDRKRGTLRLDGDALAEYIQLSLSLLGLPKWNAIRLRFWTSKTLAIAMFRRSLVSGMGRVLEVVKSLSDEDLVPSPAIADELMVLCCQSPLSVVGLRAPLSREVSCTHANPKGGKVYTAGSFAEASPGVPEPIACEGACGQCGKLWDQLPFTRFDCPNKCGMIGCSLECIAAHRHVCGRGMLGKACFGERFSGANCPLSVAMASEGIFVQAPLDLLRDNSWDFFTTSGRECLEGLEDDGHLVITHWAPEHKTFWCEQGNPLLSSAGRWERGPSAIRSREKPWGLPHLSRDNQVKVRQANSMAKRSLSGVKDAHLQGRYACFEHPWESLVWFTTEAKELCDMQDMFTTYFCGCCFDSPLALWMCLVHNMPELHAALHKPQCSGHVGISPLESRQYFVALQTAGALEAEYPKAFCCAYAAAAKALLTRLNPSPCASIFNEESAIFSALRSSARGFQSPTQASITASGITTLLQSMTKTKEKEHLLLILHQACLRGMEVKLWTCHESGSQSLLTPYPAHRWDWEERLVLPWDHQLSAELGGIAAFLLELRRRTRDRSQMGSLFICVGSNLAVHLPLSKGMSNSSKQNLLLRRVNALLLMADVPGERGYKALGAKRKDISDEEAEARACSFLQKDLKFDAFFTAWLDWKGKRARCMAAVPWAEPTAGGAVPLADAGPGPGPDSDALPDFGAAAEKALPEESAAEAALRAAEAALEAAELAAEAASEAAAEVQ
eukprot:s1779_g13.t1